MLHKTTQFWVASELVSGQWVTPIQWSMSDPECPVTRNSKLWIQLCGNCEEHVVLFKLREYGDHRGQQNVRDRKERLKLSIAVHGNPSQIYSSSLAIWDHTVLPATRHKWMHPDQTGRYSCLPTLEGWVDLGSLIAARWGIEPTTAWLQVQHSNHYATKPPMTASRCGWS